MKLKTYHAPTLHAALRLARIELGSEAVLLEAKERDAETAEARFQVTFALGADGEVGQSPAKVETPHWLNYVGPTEAAPEAPSANRIDAAPKTRRRAPRKTKSSATNTLGPAGAVGAPALPDPLSVLRTPELAAMFGRLVGAGVSAGEATGLVTRASELAGGDQDAVQLERGLRESLDASWIIHAPVEPKASASRLIALVGPAGAGKSVTAVKVAMLLLRAYDRPAALVSVGRHPIGGVETLEAWATLLNLRVEIVESPQELSAALGRLTSCPRPPGAVIVDTPADGSAANALSSLDSFERHLVLPATYSPADLNRAADRFDREAIDAVIFTRLDEAAAPGSIWGFQRSTGLPVSFLGCGADTPGDLQLATAKRLTLRLLGR